MRSKFHSIFYLILSFAFLVSTAGNASQEWKFEKKKDGISLYSRDSDIHSNLLAYRAEGWVNADLSRVAAAVIDADNAKDWLYEVSESKLISRDLIAGEQLLYMVQHVPVLKDRDVVIKGLLKQDPQTYVLTATLNSVANVLKDRKGMVRVPYFNGRVVLTPSADEKRTLVEFEIATDPGGRIPKKLANLFMKVGPIKTIQKLRTLDFKNDKYTPPCSPSFDFKQYACIEQ